MITEFKEYPPLKANILKTCMADQMTQAKTSKTQPATVNYYVTGLHILGEREICAEANGQPASESVSKVRRRSGVKLAHDAGKDQGDRQSLSNKKSKKDG